MGIRDSVDENGNLVSQVYNSSTGGGPQNEIGTRLAGRADSAVVVTSNPRNLWGVGERILEESGADSLTAVVFPNHSLSRVRDLAGRQGVEPLTRRLTFDPPATDVTTMCANCQGTDHTLKVCLEADRASGVVHGCAVCNAKHRMETCPKFKSLSWRQQYKMCVLDRGRMAPLDTGTQPWITAVTMADQNATGPLPEPTSLPWTEAFARNWIRSADSRTRAAMSDFYLTRDRSLLPVDPQTETLRRALTHYDIRIPLRHIRASGAVASRVPRRL
ncbi:hypothetical protein ACCO45_013517 [Purpureocillium lilacinum]|uniref:Uncharacterized protein n=1 Tax=Purpureocillium lilacinum TaxID=33203 RepID=A0ACC4D950_PURLI